MQPLDDLHPPLLSGKELVLMYAKTMFSAVWLISICR